MKRKKFCDNYRSLMYCLIILVFFLPACSVPQKVLPPPVPAEIQQAYLNAIQDAEVAEPHEISKNLTAIVASNTSLVWGGDSGDRRVLVVTWTSWDGYDKKVGQDMKLTQDVWVTIVPELQNVCTNPELPREDLTLRLEQLLGLPPRSGKTKVVEMWASPDDLFRPSPDPEITDHEAELNFPGSTRFLNVSEEYIEWFNTLKRESYGKEGYPWTRLGYTYDWGNPLNEIGLSEFVVREGATVAINSVSKTADYCQ